VSNNNKRKFNKYTPENSLLTISSLRIMLTNLISLNMISTFVGAVKLQTIPDLIAEYLWWIPIAFLFICVVVTLVVDSLADIFKGGNLANNWRDFKINE
jgi:hypothetical protein